MKLYYQTFGKLMALAIEGKSESEVNGQYYSLWNHGATSGELHWINYPFLGYIWTNELKLYKALVNSSLFKILNDNPDEFKGKKSGAINKAKEVAAQRRNEIYELNFIENKPIDIHLFKMGEIDSYQPSMKYSSEKNQESPIDIH